MRFLVDANLPPGLARWLRARGHEAAHVSDQPGLAANDREVSELAKREGRVVVSKDEDFATLVLLSSDAPPFLWIRRGNSTNRALIEWLEPRWPEIEERLAEGELLIEVV